MKLINKLMTLISFSVLILLSSCHTDTPTNVDLELPVVNVRFVYTANDTLFDGIDTNFVDFGTKISEEMCNLEVEVVDNDNVHKVSLKYKIAGNDKIETLRAIKDPESKIIKFGFNYLDFKLGDATEPKVTLFVEASDETENFSSSSEYGFNVAASTSFDKLYREFGSLKEIEGEMVDFRDKNGKLSFVQFYGEG